jgi:hypothetical protein
MKPSTAKVYALLKVRGVDGVSPDEARRWAGCDRLAARVAELRAEGHEVMTVTERHPGGNHARYVLREPRAVPTRGVQETWADWSQGELQEAFGK